VFGIDASYFRHLGPFMPLLKSPQKYSITKSLAAAYCVFVAVARDEDNVSCSPFFWRFCYHIEVALIVNCKLVMGCAIKLFWDQDSRLKLVDLRGAIGPSAKLPLSAKTHFHTWRSAFLYVPQQPQYSFDFFINYTAVTSSLRSIDRY
jgi:hypothetical protein